MTRAALWTKHRPVAHGIARDYRVPGLDADDVAQEALVALWEATGAFDPRRGPFPPFARLVVNRHLRDLLQAATREKRAVPAGRVDAELAPAPEQLSLAPLLEAHRALSDRERAAVRAHLNGLPTRSSKAHENALMRARRKLRAAA